MSEILQETELNHNAATIREVLNSTAPFDKEPSQSQVAAAVINEIYDVEEAIYGEASIEDNTSSETSKNISVAELTHSISQIPDDIDDSDFQHAVQAVLYKVRSINS